MGNFVEMVVDNFTQINKCILLNLDRAVDVNFYSWGMDNTHITDIVLAILAHNHELRFPELFVIRNNVVVWLTFTNFVYSLGTVDRYLKVLKFFSVNCLEGHVEFVSGSLVRKWLKNTATEVHIYILFSGWELTEFHAWKLFVIHKLLKTRVWGYCEAWWVVLDERAAIEVRGISLNLITKCIVTVRLTSID